ncbi:hypothetical protein MY11210_008788 [Beauveria gryllotalpidicola]
MRFSTIVAFAAGVAVAVPAPEQIILNPQNDANRPATRVSKDHESVNEVPPAVVYAIRNPEDGSVTGWKCHEKPLHGDELLCTKQRLTTKSYTRVVLEQLLSFKSILSFCLLWGILFVMVEIMIKFEAEALANEMELARLDEDFMYNCEIQSKEVASIQYED